MSIARNARLLGATIPSVWGGLDTGPDLYTARFDRWREGRIATLRADVAEALEDGDAVKAGMLQVSLDYYEGED